MEVFLSDNAICRESGGGGNRTRVSFPPDSRVTQAFPAAAVEEGRPPALCDIARSVSWDDDGPRRFLHRVFLVLAAVAVAGHYAPAWFGL